MILWDADTGALRRTLPGHRSPVRAVAFAPNGRSLATGSDNGRLRVWHVATGQELCELEAQAVGCRELIFSDDGRWLACLRQTGAVRLCEIEVLSEN